MKKIGWSVLLSSLMLIGCSKAEKTVTPEPEPPIEPAKIPIAIATGLWTRATDSAFEENDKVGLYVVNYSGGSAGTLTNSGNYVNNMCFTYSESWQPETPVYWKDQTTKADFYSYYPYSASIGNVSAHPFSVRADQSAEADYKASDFLWGSRTGVAPTADPVMITVRHAMSNLIVRLQAGQGYSEADMDRASITVHGLRTGAVINLADGSVTATGGASSMIPLKESGRYRALVVPQTVSDVKLIEVSLDGSTYSLTQSMTFESNKQHTCTLVVNRIGEGFNFGIDGWETDGKDYGGIVE